MKATIGNMETYNILTMLLVKESYGLYLSGELWLNPLSLLCVYAHGYMCADVQTCGSQRVMLDVFQFVMFIYL